MININYRPNACKKQLRGKDELDTRHAEAALLNAALGYSYTEVVKERTAPRTAWSSPGK
jgi:hypothetical protein